MLDEQEIQRWETNKEFTDKFIDHLGMDLSKGQEYRIQSVMNQMFKEYGIELHTQPAVRGQQGQADDRQVLPD